MSASVLGIGPEITYQGKTYRFKELDFAGEAAAERRLQREAAEAIEAHKEAMGPTWYRDQQEGWRRDCAARAFRWNGSACWDWSFTPEGLTFLAWIMLSRNHAELTEEFVAKWAADKVEGPKLLNAALEAVHPNVSRLLQEKTQEPA